MILLIIVLIALTVTGYAWTFELWCEYKELHEELFDLKYPQLNDKDGVMAAYLMGRAEKPKKNK